MFLINVERNLAEESNLGNDNSSLNELLSLLLYCIFCALLLFSILFCILHPLVLLLLFDCFLLICFVHLIRIDLVFVEFIGVRSTFAIFEENTRSGKSLYDATMLEMEDETQSFGVDFMSSFSSFAHLNVFRSYTCSRFRFAFPFGKTNRESFQHHPQLTQPFTLPCPSLLCFTLLCFTLLCSFVQPFQYRKVLRLIY